MSVSLRLPSKLPQSFSSTKQPPLNADCSIHLTPQITDGKTRKHWSRRDELPVRVGLVVGQSAICAEVTANIGVLAIPLPTQNTRSHAVPQQTIPSRQRWIVAHDDRAIECDNRVSMR